MGGVVRARDLRALEGQAYRRAYDDGIVDLFVGVSLVVIGSIWVWLPDYGGMAGILPAVTAVAMVDGRRRFVESRGGYVRWSDDRRRWEARSLTSLLIAGVAMLVVGVGVFLAVGTSDDDVLGQAAPGLIAWLLALPMLGLGVASRLRRVVVYATVLVLGGAATVSTDGNPGWPLLATGVLATLVGAWLLRRYVRDNPRMDDA